MNGFKKFLSYLIILLLLGSVLFLCVQRPILERLQVLTQGHGSQRYELVGVGEDGTACAAGWSQDGLKLTFFEPDGKGLSSHTVKLPEELRGGILAQLYPVDENLVYLGVYGPNAQNLSIYRIYRKGEAERLLLEECQGASSIERQRSVTLFSFSQNESQIYFSLLSGGTLSGYACTSTEGGVRKVSEAPGADVRTAAVLPNETLASGGNGFLTVGGGGSVGWAMDQQVVFLTQTGTGLYYLDALSMNLYYSDLTGVSVGKALELAPLTTGRTITSLTVSDRGEALLLLDGHDIVLAGKTGGQALEVLYPTARNAIVTLVAACVALVVMSWLVWYLFCGVLWRSQIPMALQRSAALIALALLVGIVGYQCVFLPESLGDQQEKTESLVNSVARLVIGSGGMTDPGLPDRLSQALEAAEGSPCQNVSAVAAHRNGEGWTDGTGGRAEVLPYFDASLAETALEEGTACLQDGDTFRFCLSQEDWVLSVSLCRKGTDTSRMAQSFFLALALITGVGILIQILFSQHIRRLSRAVEKLSRGENAEEELWLRTGDELEGMASALSSLGASIKRQAREREELAMSYRRFVPEQVLSLLGKESIQEVDKKTFATRRMAVMMVRFYFPEPVYSGKGNSRLLFDSVNQVIERTASIATGRGGTVFNFAFNGYDVVMGEDCPRVVSTAVAMAQEVLSFNERRALAGLPTVTFHVALDVGDVMLGVVGDSTQMEPTTISTSFSTVNELIGLCDQLEANILCTEAIISGVEGYGSRYMGKCWQENVPIRVYEIFSGDAFNVRRGKENSVRRFSQGVLALYSGETAAAKRIFLDLAHKNSGDGGVRYYLYLADHLERNPSQPCGLNTLKNP